VKSSRMTGIDPLTRGGEVAECASESTGPPSQAVKREMGYSGAEMAPFLGVTTSSVNWLAASEILPKVRKYLNAL